ncbi:Hint domain-containing protein [Cognatishimia maritima]|uniref:Hint domain-containing protein n=1 Tax=Cognatishimia maritima TaxID=870908 RepID=A0A1M5I477_9RHOB|nr:Hint domain-containing protein [Cognatishimia maritima]SHG22643.1 Hint domain-containing protein [Cognatishimia maritima]
MKFRVVNRRMTKASAQGNQAAGQDNIFHKVAGSNAPAATASDVRPSCPVEIARPAVFLRGKARAERNRDVRQAADTGAIAGIAAQALVMTLDGQKPAGQLRAGDRLLTRDSGYQPLLWQKLWQGDAQTQCYRLKATHSQQDTHILVTAGQGILLSGREVLARYGAGEFLVKAADLSAMTRTGFAVDRTDPMPFVTLLLAQHELINVDGIWVSSLLPNAELRSRLTQQEHAALAEILPAFDESRQNDNALTYASARSFLSPEGQSIRPH